MTLAEGKRKAYELLDEYSSGGVVEIDDDLELKMADLFDTAQKKLAQTARIVRLYTPEREAGVTEYAMPEDFVRLCRIWRNGRESSGRYRWRGNKLLIDEGDAGEIQVEYFARPATLSAATPDSYVFEISEEAAAAMPFFVAAQILSSDLVQDAGTLLALYQMMVEGLSTTPTGETRRVRNAFYQL